MRALGVTRATRCEEAKSRPSACRCRCKGKLHGASRGVVWGLDFYDPHYPARKGGMWEQMPLPLPPAQKESEA